MKVHYKLLAAALALAAASGAQAAIDGGQTTNGTGELFVVVTDTTAGFSFVGDLGVGMDTFLPTSNSANSWSLSGFSSWSPFLSAIGGDLSNAKFAVYALDNVGATSTVDAKRLLTTAGAADDVLNNYTTANNKLGAAVGSGIGTTWLVNGVQVDANNLANDHDTLANGSSYTNSTKTAAYAEAQIGDQLKNNMPFVTTVAASDAASFWLLGNSSSSTLAQADVFMQAGQFSIASGPAGGYSLDYTVATVPEADTWAMMLAGLGLVGALVRRRKA
jgi:MYXO-CTERM domain-containing protein